MKNFKDEILKAANSDILGVVIRTKDESDEGKFIAGKVYDWCEVQDIFDYEHEAGYGWIACNAIYAWTKDQVLFVAESDGATDVVSIPRHPINIIPEYC